MINQLDTYTLLNIQLIVMKCEAIAINCVDMVWGAQAFIYENLKVYTHRILGKNDSLFDQ